MRVRFWPMTGVRTAPSGHCESSASPPPNLSGQRAPMVARRPRKLACVSGLHALRDRRHCRPEGAGCWTSRPRSRWHAPSPMIHVDARAAKPRPTDEPVAGREALRACTRPTPGMDIRQQLWRSAAWIGASELWPSGIASSFLRGALRATILETPPDRRRHGWVTARVEPPAREMAGIPRPRGRWGRSGRFDQVRRIAEWRTFVAPV